MDDGVSIREKASDHEADIRRETIFEMIIKGYRTFQIIRFCTEKFNIGSRQVEAYIKQVKDQIKSSETDREYELKKAKKRYEDLYQKNYTIQDYKEARAVQDSLNKLIGLNEPDKKEIQINDATKTYESWIDQIKPDAE